MLHTAVFVHLAFVAIHGLVHLVIPVHLGLWQGVYAIAVILIAPLVGAGLAERGHLGLGAWVILCAGVGAFLFEAGFHFLIENPDHVHAVEDRRLIFAATAVLTTIGNVALILVGSWIVLTNQVRSSEYATL